MCNKNGIISHYQNVIAMLSRFSRCGSNIELETTKRKSSASVSADLMCNSWWVDAYDAIANIEICFIFDGVGRCVVVIVSTPVARREAVEMMQAQIQSTIVRDECADGNQNSGHIIEFQPLIHLFLRVNWCLGKVAHHMLMCAAVFQNEHAADT